MQSAVACKNNSKNIAKNLAVSVIFPTFNTQNSFIL